MNGTPYARLLAWIDRMRWQYWLRYSNGASQLQAASQAVEDAVDSMEAIGQALVDQDNEEAQRLVLLALVSLDEHAKMLKGLL